MADDADTEVVHSTTKAPKFCKCRVCHEYFYAETIDKANKACHKHWQAEHPEWHESVCYCPDY